MYVQHRTHEGWPAGGSKIKLNSLGRNRLSLKKYIYILLLFETFELVIQKKEKFKRKVQPVPLVKSLKRFSCCQSVYLRRISPENKKEIKRTNRIQLWSLITSIWRGGEYEGLASSLANRLLHVYYLFSPLCFVFVFVFRFFLFSVRRPSIIFLLLLFLFKQNCAAAE